LNGLLSSDINKLEKEKTENLEAIKRQKIDMDKNNSEIAGQKKTIKENDDKLQKYQSDRNDKFDVLIKRLEDVLPCTTKDDAETLQKLRDKIGNRITELTKSVLQKTEGVSDSVKSMLSGGASPNAPAEQQTDE